MSLESSEEEVDEGVVLNDETVADGVLYLSLRDDLELSVSTSMSRANWAKSRLLPREEGILTFEEDSGFRDGDGVPVSSA